MDLKQSAGRITAWAKSHPWAAAGVVGFVIFIAWYASKHAPASKGISLDTSAAATGPDPSALGAGDGLSGVLSQLGQSTSPNYVPPPLSPAATVTGEEVNNAVHSHRAGGRDHSESAVRVPNVHAIKQAVVRRERPPKVDKPDKVKVKTKTPKVTHSGGNKTPAELLGKGKHFTGWFQGIYYMNGYPMLQGPTGSKNQTQKAANT